MKKYLLVLFCLLLVMIKGRAQVKLGDNLRAVNPRTVLELESTTKGFLLPRLTTLQMETLSSGNAIKLPIYGMTVFNTDSGCIAQYTDTTRADRWGWTYLCGSTDRKLATGARNGLTLKDSVVVLGGQLDRRTIDTLNDVNMEWETNGNGQLMVRKRNGDTALIGRNTGHAGIGVGTPLQALQVGGSIQLSQALMPGGMAGGSGQILVSRGNNTPQVWRDSVAFTAQLIPQLRDSLANTFRKSPVKDSLRNLITRGDGLVFTSTVATNSVIADISSNFTSNTTYKNVFNNPCTWGNTTPDISFNSLDATLDHSTGTITVGKSGLFNMYCFLSIGIVFSANTTATATGGVGVLSAIIRCPAGANINVADNWEVVTHNAYQYHITNSNGAGMANGISLNGMVQVKAGDRLRVVAYRTAVTADNPTVTRGVVVVPAGLPFGFLFKLTRLVGT